MIDRMIDALNKTITTFVKSFNEEYSARFAENFMADLDTDTVEWALSYVENGGEAFYNNFVMRYPFAKHYSFFLLCLLHEIGHLETEWDMDDDTDIRNNIHVSTDDYFNLHNEYIATEWAGEWLQENPSAADAIQAQLDEQLEYLFNALLTE